MGSHDIYGKQILHQATGGTAIQYGAPTNIDYGTKLPACIDGTVDGFIAVEIESRVSKQVRGAVLDLICHPYPKKLLLLLPVHMKNPSDTAIQCRNILKRFCNETDFRVEVLKGYGGSLQIEDDVRTVAQALRDLGASIVGLIRPYTPARAFRGAPAPPAT